MRDDGSGIPRDEAAAVFARFVQVRSGPTSAQEGTGLRLAISRQWARGIGGDLVVESTAILTLMFPA